MNSPYHDLDLAKQMALHFATVHKMKYNVVIMIPDGDGQYDKEAGSTYEIVLDSAFGNTNIKIVKVVDTDELKKQPTLSKIKFK